MTASCETDPSVARHSARFLRPSQSSALPEAITELAPLARLVDGTIFLGSTRARGCGDGRAPWAASSRAVRRSRAGTEQLPKKS
jgi:hypothetical protein